MLIFAYKLLTMNFLGKWFGNNKDSKFISYISAMFGMSNSISAFSESNAFSLALQLSEIFNPIDAIASRASSITYEIQDSSGRAAIPNADEKRLMDSPNPLNSFGDLVYSMIFSELSDGNSYTYRADLGKSLKQSNIANIWNLPPNLVSIKYKSSIPDFFFIKDKSDFIDSYRVNFLNRDLDPSSIIHRTSSFYRTSCANGLIEGRSPLTAVEKNINNLLAVYSARYKVYENNGMAGILTRASTTGNGEVADIFSASSREDIINDIMSRNGLTGDKKLLAVSSIPLSFIKTLGTISELQPFEETEADGIAIAGIFGVDKELIPKKASSTYTNKQNAEVSLWQNVIKGICWDVCRSLDGLFLLENGRHFVPIFDDVEVLQTDAKTKLEGDGLMIDNILKIESSGLQDNELLKKIIESYANAR